MPLYNMSIFKQLNKKTKNLDVWDISLTKLAVATGIIFLLGIWPAANQFIFNINPWCFLILALIFSIRPLKRFFGK